MDSNPTMSTAVWFLNAGELFNLFFTPLLCLFGAMGNCLSVWVFCKSSSHRNLSSSFYLSALAISDTGFLINLLAVWLTNIGFDVMSSRLTCPLIYYLGQVTSFLSVWLTVAFTVERFFAVCYPLTRPTVCTVARAKKVICGLVLVAASAFSYMWIIATVIHYPESRMMDIAPSTTTSIPTTFPNLNDANAHTNRIQISYSHLQNSSNFHPASENNCTAETCGKIIKANDEASVIFLRNEPETDVRQEIGIYGDNQTMNENGTTHINYKSICYVLDEYTHFSRIANYVDSVLTFILPFFVITFLNMKIAVCVWRLRGQRDHIMAPTRATNSLNLTQRSSSRRLKDQLISISRRKSSKGKQIFKNGFSVNYQEGNCNINNGNNSNGTGANGNGSSGHPFVKINIEMDPESNVENVNTIPSRISDQNQTSVNIQPRALNINSVGNNTSPSQAAEVKVTKTLLLVSTVFLVLNFPDHAIRATFYLKSLWGSTEASEENPSTDLILLAVQSWSKILFNTNFAVNFLLYCVSGKNFRKSLRSIFFGGRGESNRRATSFRSTMRSTHRDRGKSNRMTSNNANANAGNGIGHRRENGILKKTNTDKEKESLFAAASVTEIEMETTYA